MTHELSRREMIAGTGAIASISMLSGLIASSAEATQWGHTPREETMRMLSGLFGSNAEAAEAWQSTPSRTRASPQARSGRARPPRVPESAGIC